jgi:hypothetical protein
MTAGQNGRPAVVQQNAFQRKTELVSASALKWRSGAPNCSARITFNIGWQ